MNKQKLENLEICFRAYIRLTEAIVSNKDSLAFIYWPMFTVDKSLENVRVGMYTGSIGTDPKVFIKSLAAVCLTSIVAGALNDNKKADDFAPIYKEMVDKMNESDKIYHFKKTLELLESKIIKFLQDDTKTDVTELRPV